MAMATAPPILADPSRLYFNMPPPAAAVPMSTQTRSSDSSTLNIVKVVIGLIIALVLIAILAAFIFLPRQNQSNELQQSNENIARLDREHALFLEKEREEHVEKMAERKRVFDQAAERQRQEFQLFLALEQSRREQDLQQQEFELLRQGQRQTERFHEEQQKKDNDDALQKFIDDVSALSPPYDFTRLQLKVLSLLRRLDAVQKSSLIVFLYQMGFLSIDGKTEPFIDLRGANLKELNVNDVGQDLESVDIFSNFTFLALPASNLINATFEKVFLHDSSFVSANLIGASFRTSFINHGDFRKAKLSLSDFRQANAMESLFNDATIQSASFTETELFGASFTRADLTKSRFMSAKLVQTKLNNVLAPGANFYSAQAFQADFSSSYMPDARFEYANLNQATFRSAYLTGVSFDSANVYEADFTRAYLIGANITAGQLDLALSIAYASLPDGSIGRNKNLIKKTSANCTDNDGNIFQWTSTGGVVAEKNETTKQCVFQGLSVNSTLEQRLSISRYQPLLKDGRGRVYIELHSSVTPESTPLVYMNVDFLNNSGNQIGVSQTTLNNARLTPPSIFVSSLSCPPETTELRLTLVFSTINAAVQNVYVTLE